MAQYVTIYSPEGEPVKHTLPNARDLVAHAAWTWKPGKKWTPVEGAPYARPELAQAGDKAQAILDRAGAPAAGAKTAIEQSVPEVVASSDPVLIEEGPDELPFEPEAEAVEEDDAAAEEEAEAVEQATPRRGGRAKKDT